MCFYYISNVLFPYFIGIRGSLWQFDPFGISLLTNEAPVHLGALLEVLSKRTSVSLASIAFNWLSPCYICLDNIFNIYLWAIPTLSELCYLLFCKITGCTECDPLDNTDLSWSFNVRTSVDTVYHVFPCKPLCSFQIISDLTVFRHR